MASRENKLCHGSRNNDLLLCLKSPSWIDSALPAVVRDGSALPWASDSWPGLRPRCVFSV